MNVLEAVENDVKGTFNANHPELRDGEIWLTNSLAKDFGCISWRTARAGEQAYKVNGEAIISTSPELKRYPVFVQRDELKGKEME